MDQARVKQLLIALGFEFSDDQVEYNGLVDTPDQRIKFSCLQELMGGFALYIATEYYDNSKEDVSEDSFGEVAQEWLIG